MSRFLPTPIMRRCLRSHLVWYSTAPPADDEGAPYEDVPDMIATDLASDKAGSPSPWVSSSVWDSEAIDAPAPKSLEVLLQTDVAIPFTTTEREVLPSETTILEKYDSLLSQVGLDSWFLCSSIEGSRVVWTAGLQRWNARLSVACPAVEKALRLSIQSAI